MRLFTLIALTGLSAQAKPLDLKVQEGRYQTGCRWSRSSASQRRP